MPKIPAPQPNNEPVIPEPIADALTPTGDLGSQADENVETLRRAAATSINLNYDEMDPSEYGFLDAIGGGELESLRRLDPNGAEAITPLALGENPLIPGTDEAPSALPDPTTPGVTPEAVAEGAEVGLGSDVTVGGGGQDASDHTLESQSPSTTSADPSLIPEMVDLGDGLIVTKEQLRAHLEASNAQQQLSPDELHMISLKRQGLVGYQLIDPATGLPVPQAPGQQPAPQQQPGQPAPQQYETPDNWIDPAAYHAFKALEQSQSAGMQQILDNQRKLAQDNIDRETAALQTMAEETLTEFLHARGMDPTTDADEFANYVQASGFLPVAAQRFPGNPKAALTATYGAVYGAVDKYQAHERERIIAQHTQATAAVTAKKELASTVSSSPGTVSRATAAPKTQEERMAAAAQLIENDPNWQAAQ